MKIIDRVFMELDKKDLKAVDLASAIGVNKSVISNWKSRSTNPPADLIVPICEFLEIDVLYLLNGTIPQGVTPTLSANMFQEEENPAYNATMDPAIVAMFYRLDERDQEDIYDAIKSKYHRSIQRGYIIAPSSPPAEKENISESDPDNVDSGIA